MLRYFVLVVVLGCALGDVSPDQKVVKGEDFQNAVSNYDSSKYENLKNCTQPDVSKIRFILHTREKPSGEQITDDPASISGSSLNVKKPLKVLIHSWLQSDEWTKPVIRDYIYAQNVDVLVVDWSEHSKTCTFDSTSRYVTPVVGEALGSLLRTMITLGHKGNRKHIIAFGVGAHMAGTAARSTAPHRIARITGLDPVYHEEFDQPYSTKLSAGDAKFVDIILTSSPYLSFMRQLGDVTFYPNGGLADEQPACFKETEYNKKIVCAHALAYKFFSESIASSKKFLARQCDSYEKFQAGKCNDNSSTHMGEYVDKEARGLYFLKTAPESPYDLNSSPRA